MMRIVVLTSLITAMVRSIATGPSRSVGRRCRNRSPDRSAKRHTGLPTELIDHVGTLPPIRVDEAGRL